MVSVNFTLLVLLVMFLVFLWVMHRFIFTPLLALMDARTNQVAEDKKCAAAAAAEATELEDAYGEKLAQVHREANRTLVRAHRQAQEEHNARLAAFRAQAEQEIDTLRQALTSDVVSQEDQFDSLSETIQHVMAAKLELE